MSEPNTIYREYFSLEQKHQMAQLHKRAKKVTETSSRLRPKMGRHVIWPSILAFWGGWGLIFAVCLITMTWKESWYITNVWVFTAGISLLLGSFWSLVVLQNRLAEFDNRAMVTRTFELAAAETGRARIMTRDPDNPRRNTITRYQWPMGKLREFAADNVDQYGEWTGSDRLIRDDLDGYVTYVTKQFKNVKSDWQANGWIEGDDNRWTAKGKAEMAKRAVGQ